MVLIVGLTALLTFCLTSLPGWLLVGRARLTLGQMLAAGFASTFAVLTATALLSELTGHLPPWSTALVALAASFTIWLKGRDQPIVFPHCPPVLLLVPAAMALHAYVSYRIGFGIDQHPAVFRAWYNADWFKHLGHTHALVNLGLPAKDIFGGGDRLHYYWLFYLLPAVGGSIHGDAMAAVAAINVVLVFFFWLLVAGFLKELGLSDRKASVLTLIGWTVFTMDGFLQLLSRPSDLWLHITTAMMSSSLLASLNTFIPQHLLTTAGLLSFGMLWLNKPARWTALRWLALAPVIAAGITSTLLGVSVVATAALTILFFGPGRIGSRMLVVGAAAFVAIGLVLVLQVVDFSFGAEAIASPAFEGAANTNSPLEGIFFGFWIQFARLGLALPLGIWGLARGFGRRSNDRPLIQFSALMLCVAMGVMIGSEGFLHNLRLVGELRYRNSYLACLALLGGMGVLLRDLSSFGRSGRSVLALFALAMLLAIPSNILNFIWQGWSTQQWQVVVPDDDMRVLQWLKGHSGVRDVVLNYPEPVYLMDGGRDTWVPIFAGRMVLGSYRSTVWSEGKKQVTLAQRFYAGDLVKVPVDADYVYLSRTLHPATYDALVRRMAGETGWIRDYCLADACLFKRASSTGSK